MRWTEFGKQPEGFGKESSGPKALMASHCRTFRGVRVWTRLLAQYFRDLGLGEWEYVSGIRSSDEQSHAWLEKDGWIVDMTADQFDDRWPRSVGDERRKVRVQVQPVDALDFEGHMSV